MSDALSSNTKYYKETYHLFQQCSKNEDRQDLANKIFEEASSTTTDTLQITKACSREFEQLLPHVTSNQTLTIYFDRVTESNLDELIRDRSACFVLEKLLQYLPRHLATDQEQIRPAFDRLFQCVCENFEEYIKETGTSHIVTSTIAFLHPLIIASDHNEYESLIDGGRTEREFFQFPSEWNIPEKLRQIKTLVKKDSNYNEYVYATLLRTCGYLNEKFYQKLVSRMCEKHYPEFQIEHLLDKRSSFLFEVLLEFPSEQRDTKLYPLVVNHLDEIYLHSIGNFLFQHLLLTLKQKELIEQFYQLLTEVERFEKLLRQSHIRLLVTFLRICERFDCHYEDLINRIKSGLENGGKDFIPSVLKLRAGNDCSIPRDIGTVWFVLENADTQSITKEGSLVVQALLRADRVDSFTRQSFLSLTGEQISTIACHPSGSHLLCQLILQSKLWPTLREKQFYQKLEQVYTKMACDKYACWFVTQLWKSAKTIDQKLYIAKGLAPDFQMLRSHTYARFIAYEMNLTAYCSRAEQWKRSMEITLAKHALLDDLNDEDGKERRINKKKKKKINL